MDSKEATDKAVAYAAGLGFGQLPIQKVHRGATWWVVALRGGVDLGFIIVEDSGQTHIEATPFSHWFKDLAPA